MSRIQLVEVGAVDERGHQRLQANAVFFAEAVQRGAVDVEHAQHLAVLDQRDHDLGIRCGVAGDVAGEGVHVLDQHGAALGGGSAADAAERKTIVVPDVHAFPGHIACDSASNSEIVIPLIKDDKVVGVFDIDSPLPDRFSEEDREGLERMLAAFMDGTDFS